LEPVEFKALIDWSHRIGCGRASAGSPVMPAAKVVEGAQEALVAALLDGERLLGFAVAVVNAAPIGEATLRSWSSLREPLSAALRLELERHEIARLRTALEEDKRALL